MVDPRWIVPTSPRSPQSDATQQPVFSMIVQCLEGPPVALAVAGSGNYGSANQMAEVMGQSAW